MNGPPYPDPAPVYAQGLIRSELRFHDLVELGVVHPDDAGVDADAIGDPEIPVHGVVKEMSQGGLAVPWRTKDEKAARRGPGQGRHLGRFFGKDQVGDGLGHLLGRNDGKALELGGKEPPIGAQGHRRGIGVAGDFHQPPGALAALVGDGVAIVQGTRGSQVLDELLVPELLHELRGDRGRKTQVLGCALGGKGRNRERVPESQVGENVGIDLGLVQEGRRRRNVFSRDLDHPCRFKGVGGFPFSLGSGDFVCWHFAPSQMEFLFPFGHFSKPSLFSAPRGETEPAKGEPRVGLSRSPSCPRSGRCTRTGTRSGWRGRGVAVRTNDCSAFRGAEGGVLGNPDPSSRQLKLS